MLNDEITGGGEERVVQPKQIKRCGCAGTPQQGS